MYVCMYVCMYVLYECIFVEIDASGTGYIRRSVSLNGRIAAIERIGFSNQQHESQDAPTRCQPNNLIADTNAWAWLSSEWPNAMTLLSSIKVGGGGAELTEINGKFANLANCASATSRLPWDADIMTVAWSGDAESQEQKTSLMFVKNISSICKKNARACVLMH